MCISSYVADLVIQENSILRLDLGGGARWGWQKKFERGLHDYASQVQVCFNLVQWYQIEVCKSK